ncbi:protein N-terminal asparagine amidohydrolase isoform X2 [Diospyros lotus]|uniref:protein N-terminal asparagine amidohydrolase isoform X2 n=1 Tax=Diospyros lotus TaxID=55363 RepID=UPI002259121D|nr:protein N-terminal asparagine amidohydrolase isoform X2 [Diospyros lotus]
MMQNLRLRHANLFYMQGSTMLVALMEHPVLVSASSSVKAIPTWKFTIPEESGSEKSRQSKCVYVFQREYATVDPAYVDFVGTDEATTCVGLSIRNRTSGMTSVSHMDSPNVVDIGLTQMLNSVFNENSDAELDVHLVGGFQDVSPQQAGGGSRCKGKLKGYSFPLCAKIVETLQSRGERFLLQTLHVLGHNTRWDSAGNACPIFNGFLVETSTGSIFPASFDKTSRCPDEIVRRTRLAACFEDTNLSGRLLEVYDTQTDRFIIAPFFWTEHLLYIASTGEKLSDSEILLSCSTSPFAEGPDFVDNERRLWGFLIENPDWRDMFPMEQPRVFERAESGFWIRQ